MFDHVPPANPLGLPNMKKPRTKKDIAYMILFTGIFVGFFIWPMLAMFGLSLHTGVSGWDLAYSLFFVEIFWLAVVGGFVFIMWADKKKLCH